MKKVFFTFGTQESYNIHYNGARASEAAERLYKQTQKCGLFDNVFKHDENYLNDQPEWACHKLFVDSNPRGFGFWLWKPWLIRHHMSKLNIGDRLMYADSGCEIIPSVYKHLENLLHVQDFDICIGFPGLDDGLKKEPYTTKQWTKKALLDRVNLSDEILNSKQRQASTMIITINEHTINTVDRWLGLCVENNYRNLNDDNYGVENYPEFIDHRHDQAILSLVLKKSSLRINDSIARGIKVIRNRSGKSIFK